MTFNDHHEGIATAALVAGMIFAFAPAAANADEGDDVFEPSGFNQTVSGTTARVPDPVPGVDALIAPTAQTLATASASGATKGSVFRANIVPLLAVDAPYIPVVSELKFGVATDTSTSLTQITLGLSQNPFALRSKRGIRILGETMEKAQCGDSEYKMRHRLKDGLKPMQEAVAKAQAEVAEAEKALAAAETDVVSRRKAVDLVLASEASDRVAQFQQAEAAWATAVAEENRAAAAAKGAAERLEKTRSAKHRASDEALATLKQLNDTTRRASVRLPDGTEVAPFQECYDKMHAEQWRSINSTLQPQVGLTFGLDLYPWGRVPDPTDATGQTTADLEPFGGASGQLSLSFHLLERFGIDLWGTYKRARASGDPHTKVANIYGSGLTVSGLVWSFMDDSKPGQYPDYIKSGFIPGLALGASGQVSFCDGQSACAKGRTDLYSVTPFVDIRVKPELQFRLALPISFFKTVDKKDNEIAPTFSLAGSIAGL